MLSAALGRWQRAQLCPSSQPGALAPSAAHRELKPFLLFPFSRNTSIANNLQDKIGLQAHPGPTGSLGQPDFVSVYAVWFEVVLLLMKQQRTKGFIAAVL